eukprot:m.239746 g.239746  ORF g.239746 m.239746 type:complete len:53 (+) comp22802_c0_seq1:437-595(+)
MLQGYCLGFGKTLKANGKNTLLEFKGVVAFGLAFFQTFNLSAEGKLRSGQAA